MRKLCHLFLSLYVILIIYNTSLFAQTTIDVYDFNPITSSENWKYISYKEKVEALQIPDSILKVMSTEDLIETCLNYPLFGVITAFNNMETGFEQISSEFNGFQELFHRNDKGQKLLEKYKFMNPSVFDENWTNIRKGQFAVEFFYIEFILAQEEILKSLNKKDALILLKECLSKHRIKCNYDLFNSFGITTPFVMARTLNFLNDEVFSKRISENKDYSIFLNSLIIKDRKIIDEIELLTEQYLTRNL